MSATRHYINLTTTRLPLEVSLTSSSLLPFILIPLPSPLQSLSLAASSASAATWPWPARPLPRLHPPWSGILGQPRQLSGCLPFPYPFYQKHHTVLLRYGASAACSCAAIRTRILGRLRTQVVVGRRHDAPVPLLALRLDSSPKQPRAALRLPRAARPVDSFLGPNWGGQAPPWQSLLRLFHGCIRGDLVGAA